MRKQSNRIIYRFPRMGKKSDNVLIDIIVHTESTLDIAIFTLTDTAIMDAIISARKHGVTVRLITDKLMALTFMQLYILKKLKNAGVLIKKNRHAGFMHLKLTISDHKTATVSSANFTKSAQKKNDEIFLRLDNKMLAVDLSRQFEKMWNCKKDYREF